MRISTFLREKFLMSLFFPSHNRGKVLPRKLKKLLQEKPGLWDLPELPEIGSPLSESGLISDIQNDLSKKFNANNCWFGVNGASGLIQSAIISLANPGEYILLPRNIHISAIKICSLINIIPVFFDLEFSEETGHYLPLTKDWLKDVLNHQSIKNKKISGIVLVNPHYQGFAAEINQLIEVCHDKNIPVLVDEAHGSYFLFCEDFGLPSSAVRSKADLVVHSLHKSLNGLTQTAILWHCGNLIKKEKIESSLDLLQTTSPSSLLLSSCEESIKDWFEDDRLKKFKKRISEARIIFEDLSKKGIPLVKNQDPLKIVLNTSCFGIDGFTADKFFYEKSVIAELPEMMTLTFNLGFSKHNKFVSLFTRLWNELIFNSASNNKLKPIKPPFGLVEIPEITPAEAIGLRSQKVTINDSIGMISADTICPYPPGIPLIIPGEKIDKKRVEWLLKQRLYSKDLISSYIKVLKFEK